MLLGVIINEELLVFALEVVRELLDFPFGKDFEADELDAELPDLLSGAAINSAVGMLLASLLII